jgi:diguanylate cyclase (GGDEF)-like protein/PAS domain S-box-containing protein
MTLLNELQEENDALRKRIAALEEFLSQSHQNQVEEELRASQARYSSLFEQSHDAVFLSDLQGRNLAINQRAADMFGYTIEEMMHVTVRDISVEVDQSLNTVDRLLAGDAIPTYERWYRKKDGQLIPTEVNIELIRDERGIPLYIQSVVRDITQRKLVEKALQTANQELTLRVHEVEHLQAELREQALRDPLTGLYNRRYLNESMPRELARARRDNVPLSVIISDIDHFKRINDTHTHPAGDLLLAKIAEVMKSRTRDSDILCRYGGEEFLFIFPGADQASAIQRAEEIRRTCLSTTVQYRDKLIRASLSFGVATYPDHGLDAEEIIVRADIALYVSKNTGRNRVTVWDPSQQLPG